MPDIQNAACEFRDRQKLPKLTYLLPISEERMRPPKTPRDARFSALLSRRDWMHLPAAVRTRFSQHRAAGESVVYRGTVTRITFSRLGWLLAQAARLIGAPLPVDRDTQGQAATVVVTEALNGRGQIWTRLIAREGRFPQVINSAKRFFGPTGLEECIGRGVGIGLAITAENGSLIFRSTSYFIEAFGYRIPLPRWMQPGRLTIGHHDLRHRRFAFTLDLDHPLAGKLIHQTAIYTETEDPVP